MNQIPSMSPTSILQSVRSTNCDLPEPPTCDVIKKPVIKTKNKVNRRYTESRSKNTSHVSSPKSLLTV